MGIRDIVEIYDKEHGGNCKYLSFRLTRRDFASFCCFLASLQVFGRDLRDPDYEWNNLVPDWESYSSYKGVEVELEVVWSDVAQMLKVLERFNPRQGCLKDDC